MVILWVAPFGPVGLSEKKKKKKLTIRYESNWADMILTVENTELSIGNLSRHVGQGIGTYKGHKLGPCPIMPHTVQIKDKFLVQLRANSV